LSCLANLRNITLSRNAFISYPLGGPAQFCSVIVRTQSLSISISIIICIIICIIIIIIITEELV